MKLITVEELSEILGIHVQTIYRRMDDPDFPPRVKIGPQTVRFKEQDVWDYIEKNTEEKGKLEKVKKD